MTPIDTAHAEMEANPDNDIARMRLYERLIDAELFMLLETESDGRNINPDLFILDDQEVALVFDREERLADFAERIVPFAALSGRSIVAMLNGKNIGLGLNLTVSPSSIILPPDVITWISETISKEPLGPVVRQGDSFHQHFCQKG